VDLIPRAVTPFMRRSRNSPRSRSTSSTSSPTALPTRSPARSITASPRDERRVAPLGLALHFGECGHEGLALGVGEPSRRRGAAPRPADQAAGVGRRAPGLMDVAQEAPQPRPQGVPGARLPRAPVGPQASCGRGEEGRGVRSRTPGEPGDE